MAAPRSLFEHVMKVLESTAEPVFLLEGAECLQAQVASGPRTLSVDTGFGPPLSAGLRSHIPSRARMLN